MRQRDIHKHGFVRGLPRWAEAGQRRSLAEAGIESAVDLAVTGDKALDDVRRGDGVVVYHLHLLAERGRHGLDTRTHLAWWVVHLVKRGAVIIETATGRRANTAQISDIPVLLEMYAEAVEIITKGTRGRAVVRTAQENGSKSEGRPGFDATKNRALVEALHYGPPDKRVKGKDYVRRLRRLGWSRAMAYAVLGSRDGH